MTMGMIYVATPALVVFAIWFMAERIKGFSKKDVVLKMLAALCFVIVGISAVCLHPTLPGVLLLCGGICGALGDLFLGLSHLDKTKKRKNMFLGFVGFGLGHLLFCIGLILKFVMPGEVQTYFQSLTHWCYLLVPVLIGATFSTVLGVFGKKMGLHFGRYLPVVVIYGFLLSFSVALAISLNIMTGFCDLQLKIFSAGILLFIISDGILSRMYFGKLGNAPGAVIWNHVTYYVAQWFIAISILYI